MSFEIYSYCSRGFARALALTLPSWMKNSGADKIVICSDHEIRSDDERVIGRVIFDPVDDGPTSWLRKIEVVRQALMYCRTPYFCWLDADVYCAAPFSEVFARMGSADVAAARMFNHTGRGKGDLNAGVLFFQCTAGMRRFVSEWSESANEQKAKGGWFEQRAASELLHQAFHGLRPYMVAPVSENLYNLEDDNSAAWITRIEFYKPKLIHFKNRWWQRPELVSQVLKIVG